MVTSSTSLINAARSVLMEPDPFEKQKLTDEIASVWRQGRMRVGEAVQECALEDQPARSGLVQTLEPSKMPKMGKGGSLTSRQVLHVPPAADRVHVADCRVTLVYSDEHIVQ